MTYLQVHISQKAFIMGGTNDEYLLMVQYNNTRWDLPGGRVHTDESDLDVSLQREVKEETGLDVIVSETALAAKVATHPHTNHPTIYLIKSCWAANDPELPLVTTKYQNVGDNIQSVEWVELDNVSKLDLCRNTGPMIRTLLDEI